MDFNLLGNNTTKINNIDETQRSLLKRMISAEMQILSNQVAIEELEARIQLMENQLDHSTDLQIQSEDDTPTDNVGAQHEEQELVQFADGIEDNTDGMKANLDPTNMGLATSYELNQFLSRPTKIASYDIPQGEGYTVRQIKPWEAYFTNPQIKRKLDNYAYIRCNLKIKVVVNSSPFIYGCYALAYQPLQEFNEENRSTGNQFDRMKFSQRPNILIESHKNKGGELTLPFFYFKDWLATTSSDLNQMGELTLYNYISFQAANATATGNVSVTVYAWAEDVAVTGATILTVQSDDEYGQGPVSTVASAVAGVSTTLEDVPIIGAFAKATTLGANVVGAVANLFGFTNVPVIEDVKPFKNQPYHAFASSEIGVPIEKLTLDPKNELTIDPQVTGLSGEDELTVSYIAKKQSFLQRTSWLQSSPAGESLLKMNITPNMCNLSGVGNSQIRFDTPMSHISRMFNHWRGSIIVTIKLVASPYHQGRLRVSYDPRGDIYNANDVENVVVTKIIDLSVTDEAEFVIPYMQPESWRKVEFNYSENYSIIGTDPAYYPDIHNGRFDVSVLNPLTGPDTSSYVGLIAFVRAGDDFELANPGNMEINITPVEVQSADEIVSADGKITYIMGDKTSVPVDLNLVYFGEAIRSIRSVLRRTNYWMYRSTFNGTIVPGEIWYGRLTGNIYPQHHGYVDRGYFRADGLINTGSEYDYNPAVTHPITYMAMCYVGIRGSMHYNINHVSAIDYPDITVSRCNGQALKQTVATRNVFEDADFGTGFKTVGSGMMLQNEKTQNGVSFAVPFMSRYKFAPVSSRDLGTNRTNAYDMDLNNFMLEYRSDLRGETGTNSVNAKVYCGAGTDFTLLNFIGVPPKYKYAATTTAVSPGTM